MAETDNQRPNIDESFMALTEEQVQDVVRHTLAKNKSCDRAFLLRVLRYLDACLMEHAMIENVLSGALAIAGFAPDGEAQFQITEQGEREVEAMGQRTADEERPDA